MERLDRLANLGVFGAAAVLWILVGIVVTTRDGTDYPAQLLGEDPLTDVAVLRIEGTNLPIAPVVTRNASPASACPPTVCFGCIAECAMTASSARLGIVYTSSPGGLLNDAGAGDLGGTAFTR